jgi:hypothetical protein
MVALGEVVDLRMGSVRQGEEGQQMPVVGNGGVISFLYSYPSLYFWTTKLVVSSCSTSVAGYWGRLYRWWWKSTTATTGRYVSVMVLCYRQRIILRPTSKQYTANALMSCVGLGRSPLVTFHMTSSRAPTYLAWQTTRLSKDQVSSIKYSSTHDWNLYAT